MLSPFIHLFFLCSDVVLDLLCLLYSLLLFCLIKEDCSAPKKKKKRKKEKKALDMKIVWPINIASSPKYLVDSITQAQADI
jgi:hypothetical protein